MTMGSDFTSGVRDILKERNKLAKSLKAYDLEEQKLQAKINAINGHRGRLIERKRQIDDALRALEQLVGAPVAKPAPAGGSLQPTRSNPLAPTHMTAADVQAFCEAHKGQQFTRRDVEDWVGKPMTNILLPLASNRGYCEKLGDGIWRANG